ncbi:MAG: carboxypeptidase-like regulatory domain-containing protein, partial [Candidatus Cryptobacteroides sp.]|nr:carboxypeptidase-like regulatory domain-containing protein [Bacteroidales bacterium]MDY5494450.1 carboxypeptidase-like regulatory domain-containing protein [Candidatus Cryptobacteroides sp.]
MTRKSLLLLTLFLTLCLNLRGQDITVTGKVTDSSGEPLIGAAVVVDGTTNGIMVDIDGAYSLKVPSDAVLSFEMLGYLTQKIPVSGRSVINVVLTEDTQKLDEVIVVAFGTA